MIHFRFVQENGFSKDCDVYDCKNIDLDRLSGLIAYSLGIAEKGNDLFFDQVDDYSYGYVTPDAKTPNRIELKNCASFIEANGVENFRILLEMVSRFGLDFQQSGFSWEFKAEW